jgi:topoisomerase IA-like protein
MAEKTILVCDQCGRPAAETVTIRVARGNFVKDLCSTHVNELIAGARKPRRGRPRAAASKTSSTTRKKSTGKKSTRKKSTAKRGAKRRTRASTAKS